MKKWNNPELVEINVSATECIGWNNNNNNNAFELPSGASNTGNNGGFNRESGPSGASGPSGWWPGFGGHGHGRH